MYLIIIYLLTITIIIKRFVIQFPNIYSLFHPNSKYIDIFVCF